MTSRFQSNLRFRRLVGDRRPSDHEQHGFTLVELLVVMAIIGVLAAVILPAVRGPLDGLNLSGSAESIAAQFSLARQTAMSRNLPVELRIYNTGTSTAPVWNTLVLVIPAFVSNRALDEYPGTPTTLSGNAIIDPGKSFFTLSDTTNPAPASLTPPATAPWTGPPTGSASSQTVLPVLNGKTYIGFYFLADGSTNLPAQHTTSDPAWCLTVRNSNATGNGNLPAKNFVTFVIDPATGRPLVFRP